jgi:lysophospholipase L1-like esterase
MKDYVAYIALGDSMSIDLYPALDRGRPPNTPIGAVSLLYRNQSQFWPSFDRKDLVTANPELKFINLTEDGATTWDLIENGFARFTDQVASMKVLITITVGGNDALQMLRIDDSDPARITSEVAAIVGRYRALIARLKDHFPSATLICNTIYDPTDGTGILPGLLDLSSKIMFLHYINEEIRCCAEAHACLLADVHAHFQGHGISSPPTQCYYWANNPIEPSALGASELRALWLTTLSNAKML